MNDVKGCEQPRIFTPPLRELTEETTLGYEVIDFAREVLGMELLPWQRWLLVHALETVDGEDGWRLRFRNVQILVGRQSGKTTLSCVLALYFLYMMRVGLVLGTAQDVSNAEDVWLMCVEMAQANDELADEIRKVWYTNGSKRLQLDGGRDYRVKAANRRAGRGKSADLVLMDELREHQTWDAYAALSKTGMARKNALLWCMSNAGDGTSVVLRHFRIRAHRMLGDPDGIAAALGDSEPIADEGSALEDTALAIFEWSAPPNADAGDLEAWRQANPALGYTIELSTLRAAYADDPADVFKTECLCQWVTSTVDPPFPVGAWDAGRDDASTIVDGSPLWFGVDMSADRTHAAIAVCGKRADGGWHVELAAYRSGTAWLQSWFAQAAPNYAHGMRVALQSRGAPISSMLEILSAVDGVEIIECAGKDVAGYSGRLWDAVAACDGGADACPVYHRTQPALDLAANIAATRPMGDGAWAFDRVKSLEDISPLVAACMALGAATDTERAQRFKSAYAERGVMTV